MNQAKRADIFRHYNHFMQQQSDLAACLELLQRVHGDEYEELMNEHEDISDFEAKHGHDLTLMRRLGELTGDWNERYAVFHYQSILHNLESSAGGVMKTLSGAVNYPIAVSVVVGLLMLLNEVNVQPTLIALYDTFGAPPPEGWYLFRVAGFVLLPIALLFLATIVWLARTAGDPRRFLSLIERSANLPGLSTLSLAFRGFLITKIVRFAVAQGIEAGRAVDVARQSLAMVDETPPADTNTMSIERVIHSLDAANRLEVFGRELEFWETYSAEQMRNEIKRMTTLIEPITMSVLGLLVGVIIIQMYLWIFSIGDIF